jgi:hypothetical protein
VAKKGGVRAQEIKEAADLEPCRRSPSAERSTAKKRVKATYYIGLEQDIALTAIQLSERKHTSRRCDKSALVREAIDLLVKKYNITP